jgi:hypothetical protein
MTIYIQPLKPSLIAQSCLCRFANRLFDLLPRETSVLTTKAERKPAAGAVQQASNDSVVFRIIIAGARRAILAESSENRGSSP